MAGRNEYRSTSLGAALRYKGREGMWTWMLHRVTGLGILFFLILHVADTALVVYRPDLYDHALTLYKSAFFRFGEVAIFFSVLFHAFNGLRIVIQDFWPVTMRHQRKLALGAALLAVLAFLPAAWMMLAPVFGLADEPGSARYQEQSRPMSEDGSPVAVRGGGR